MGDSIEFSHSFRFRSEYRIDFYSLAKRNFFSRNLMCPYCVCINSFRENFFRISPRKSGRGIKPLGNLSKQNGDVTATAVNTMKFKIL